MPASTTSAFDWTNRLIGGGLEDKLAKWRDDGLTYRQISERLRDLNVTVHPSMAHRWVQKLERGEKP